MNYTTQTGIDEMLTTFGLTFEEFKQFPLRRLRTFKASRQFRDEFLDDTGTFLVKEAYEVITMTCLIASLNYTDNKILKIKGVPQRIKSAYPEDFDSFRIGVWELVVFFMINNTEFERITGQSVSTPNFQFSMETSRNILTSDVFGTYSKIWFLNAEFKKYKYIETQEEYDIFRRTQTGLIEFIANIEEA